MRNVSLVASSIPKARIPEGLGICRYMWVCKDLRAWTCLCRFASVRKCAKWQLPVFIVRHCPLSQCRTIKMSESGARCNAVDVCLCVRGSIDACLLKEVSMNASQPIVVHISLARACARVAQSVRPSARATLRTPLSTVDWPLTNEHD